LAVSTASKAGLTVRTLQLAKAQAWEMSCLAFVPRMSFFPEAYFFADSPPVSSSGITLSPGRMSGGALP